MNSLEILKQIKKEFVEQYDGDPLVRKICDTMIYEFKLRTMDKEPQEDTLCAGLNNSAAIIHQNNKEKGFWDKERNVGEMLMLIVSELGEAISAHQNEDFTNWENFYKEAEMQFQNGHEDAWETSFKLHVKDTFEDEIADTVIRLLDLSAGLGIDLEKHINAKVAYNKTRERLHGKMY